MRRILLLCVVIAILLGGGFWWRSSSPHERSGESSAPTIIKQPVNFTQRTFDPSNPPPDMPQLATDELAVCDSNFISNAKVGGDALPTDGTHAIVTVSKVTVTLQLNITIWVPANASQHVLEHEEGHREISEHFYQDADKLAAKIASAYVGKKFSISGANLQSELNKSLQQMSAEITEQYNRELNPNPTQLHYDAITDHSRNDVPAKDAVAQVLSEIAIASAGRASKLWN